MKKVPTFTIFVILFTIVVLSFPTIALSQHRIPNKGENIRFYPIVEDLRLTHTGYDCFYAEDLVRKKGALTFKKDYRFKKNKNYLTPLAEIENHTFLVRDIEFSVVDGPIMLMYLTREGDEEKVLLKLELGTNSDFNSLAKTMFEYKKVYNGINPVDGSIRYKHVVDRISLPYINADSLNALKERYAQKNIVSSKTTIWGIGGYVIGNQLEKDFTNLVGIVNKRKCSFKRGDIFYCMDMEFLEVSGDSLNKIPCAKLKTSYGGFIYIPLCYFDKDSNKQVYLLPEFFIIEEKYKQMEIARYGLQPLIDRYEGKDVYYGLDNEYQYENPYSQKFSAFENRVLSTNELYTLKKGETYRCDRFCILKRFDKNYEIPFAILKDKSGIEFKVPVNKVDFSNYAATVYCKEFEEYFLLSELVDSIVKNREELKRLEELARKEKYLFLTEKYGKTYADFLKTENDETIKRFDTLSKKYGKANAKLIIEGRVLIGWTKEMCRESWGSPHDINTITGSWGVHEQWVYEYSFSDSYSMYCLYFENGILTTIQD